MRKTWVVVGLGVVAVAALTWMLWPKQDDGWPAHDGKLRQTVRVEAHGLRRGGPGVVTVAGTAHYTRRAADQVAQVAIPRFSSLALSLIDPAGKAKLAYLAHHEGAPGSVKFLRGEMGYVSTATFNANVPASKRAAALAAAGGSTGNAYRDYLASYIDSRIVVTNYMVSSQGVVVPKLSSFYL